ncbi:MAG: tRNA pseudouridine(38-40) synthase TruA [Amoebophilaceae bacterium]|nr:tRNA pseudouridine(38-40) synthase TruA [Amoebophilaceae bacterium]
MRYFIYLSYLGKAYSGWQWQKNAVSIQQIVEDSLSKLFSSPVSIYGSSRTDKGVHAQQQVAHFDLNHSPGIPLPHCIYKLNRMLPKDISVATIRPVIDKAHARFDACYRIYTYSIIRKKNPFYTDTAVWIHSLPPLDLLNQIAACFCIKADFEYFSKVNKQVDTFVCTIQEATWSQLGDNILFRIKANRFLRGMVRTIVGAILKVAMQKMDLLALQQCIREKPVVRPILTLAPAHGLTLVEVGYPKKLFLTP